MKHEPDEEDERARLTALWLTAVLKEMHYTTVAIDWQHEGLQAQVHIHGHPVGTLRCVWDRFRLEDGFLPWLRSQVSEDPVRYAISPFLKAETTFLATSSARLVQQLEAFLANPADPTGMRLFNLRTMLDGIIRSCTTTDELLERIEQRGCLTR